MTWEWVHSQLLFVCKHEMYSCDRSGFRTFVKGWRMFCLALVSISVSSSSGFWCRARATAVLHLHWRGISYWALITVLIYKGNHSLSFKSQYSNDIQILAWLRDWPCMSIIPGEELFSGVVTSDPYFSSLPFFFLFFCSEVKQNINELQLRQKKSMHSCRTP